MLDHCVLADQVACRVAKNCGGQDQCVLTGYASDPRGNSSMRAVCMGPSTVTLPKPALERRQPEGADQRGRGSDPYQELFEAARHGRITASF